MQVGEAVNDSDILAMWRDHFSSIINSECPQKREEEQLRFERALREQMSRPQLPWWCFEINVSEVSKAVSRLKLNKAAGFDGIQPEHIKYGGFTLALYLSVAFTMFIRHSFVPMQFRTSYIVPVVKDRRGDMADANNYRGISVSSVVSKLMELVLMERMRNVLVTSDQQFGFKRNHSSADCSFVLRSTIDYYLERGNSRMFVCTLDLSKAYDRVPYYRVFCRLLDVGAPVYFVRLLSVWYAQQSMRVKWKEKFSEWFSVGNGVRQGSVLSPLSLMFT